ncbi:hypothetical protein IF125_07555 [Empedobacter stercoris]|uniref:hypothetical protein n=1 Tax=Empedobacter stercoris TaxID=1628248 RepID=UPI001CE19DDF|nr:hypothetical protein [Empedobacter stercoris]MCA4782120.1 hypothetical protein [Empedobacter stercoris]
MKTILSFILLQIITIADGSVKEKLLSSSIIAFITAPLVFIFDKLSVWTIENSIYVTIVCGAILIDWVFGSIKHLFFTRTFNWKYNALGLVLKGSLVVGGIFLFESLHYILQDLTFIEQMLKIVTRLVVFIYPATSAWNNMSIVSNGKFPPKSWLDKITNFNKDLDITNFKSKNKEE